MITIRLNDQPVNIAQHCSLATALQQWGYKNNYFAVAINRVFIPQSNYAKTFLANDDAVEIVSPMQGG